MHICAKLISYISKPHTWICSFRCLFGEAVWELRDQRPEASGSGAAFSIRTVNRDSRVHGGVAGDSRKRATRPRNDTIHPKTFNKMIQQEARPRRRQPRRVRAPSFARGSRARRPGSAGAGEGSSPEEGGWTRLSSPEEHGPITVRLWLSPLS